MKVEAAPSQAWSFDVPSEQIERELERWKAPGLELAAVKDDRVLFAGGFGVSDVSKRTPVTSTTLFHHGSTGKTFTALLAAILVDEGVLEWDRPVREYLPDFRLHNSVLTERVTIRDLLAHRTGVTRHELMWVANPSWSREELVRRLRYLEPASDFRTEFQYWNQGYTAAGHVIGAVTDSTWEEQLRLRILEPLGMASATTSVAGAKATGEFPRPYRIKNDEVIETEYRVIDAAAPAGQLIYNATDSATWLRFLAGGGELDGRRLASEESFKEIRAVQIPVDAPSTVPDEPEWGPSVLGLGLGPAVGMYRDRPMLLASGEIDGFRTTVLVLSEDRIGILVAVNLSGSSLPFALAFDLADRLLGHQPRAWLDKLFDLEQQLVVAMKEEQAKTKVVPGTSPSHPLDEFAGEYEHPGYGTLRVRKAGSDLEFELGELALEAEHRHFDTWTVTYDALEITCPVTFFTDAEGAVAEAHAAMEPGLAPIRFVRRPAGAGPQSSG